MSPGRIARQGCGTPTRRGTVYVYVLAVAGMVAALGLVGVSLADIAVDRAEASGDRRGAERRCRSAIDLALERLRRNPAWRAEYSDTPIVSEAADGYQTVVYITTQGGAKVNAGIPRDLRLITSTTSDDGSTAAWSIDLRVATRPRATAFKSAIEIDAETLAHEPIAYWPLSEAAGTMARDVIGHGHGVYNEAVESMARTVATIPHRGWMSVENGTICFWYFAQQRGVEQTLLAKAGTVGTDGFAITLSRSGDLHVYMGADQWTVSAALARSEGAEFGTWVHVLIQSDNGEGKLYINDEKVLEKFSFTLMSNTWPIQIGSSNGVASDLDGLVEELAFFDEMLSGADRGKIFASQRRLTNGTERTWGVEVVPGTWRRMVD